MSKISRFNKSRNFGPNKKQPHLIFVCKGRYLWGTKQYPYYIGSLMGLTVSRKEEKVFENIALRPNSKLSVNDL